jgi:hypothetical protein
VETGRGGKSVFIKCYNSFVEEKYRNNEQMIAAAYNKYKNSKIILPEKPKTTTGKVL